MAIKKASYPYHIKRIYILRKEVKTDWTLTSPFHVLQSHIYLGKSDIVTLSILKGIVYTMSPFSVVLFWGRRNTTQPIYRLYYW